MGLVEPPDLLRRHRTTVDDHDRMAVAGVLAPDARVELIEGEVVGSAPASPGKLAPRALPGMNVDLSGLLA